MYVNMQTLMNVIIDDVRHHCFNQLDTKRGAIAIAFVPHCQEAMDWAGINHSDVMVNFISPMWPCGDTIVDDINNIGTIYGDAAAIAMMKIASARVAMNRMKALGRKPKTHLDYSSAKLPKQAIGKHGLIKEKGGIAFPILRHNFTTNEEEPYMTVYVAVAGSGSEDTDDEAAWYAINPIHHGIFMEDELCIPSYCSK